MPIADGRSLDTRRAQFEDRRSGCHGRQAAEIGIVRGVSLPSHGPLWRRPDGARACPRWRLKHTAVVLRHGQLLRHDGSIDRCDETLLDSRSDCGSAGKAICQELPRPDSWAAPASVPNRHRPGGVQRDSRRVPDVPCEPDDHRSAVRWARAHRDPHSTRPATRSSARSRQTPPTRWSRSSSHRHTAGRGTWSS